MQLVCLYKAEIKRQTEKERKRRGKKIIEKRLETERL